MICRSGEYGDVVATILSKTDAWHINIEEINTKYTQKLIFTMQTNILLSK
jgi:hypothetical protein